MCVWLLRILIFYGFFAGTELRVCFSCACFISGTNKRILIKFGFGVSVKRGQMNLNSIGDRIP